MDLGHGCEPWDTRRHGLIHKLGLLFVDAMTFAYSMEHLDQKRKRAPSMASDLDHASTRKQLTSIALKGIRAML
jgi:hypothetical protein